MNKQYLVLARHGQSEANLLLAATSDGLYYSNSGSDPAVPLTELGVKQAQTLATALALQFPPERKIVCVYHNEFERVRQFAGEIAGNLGYPVALQSDPRLNKRSYGCFWNLTYKGVRELHPQEWLRFQQEGNFEYRPPDGGENYCDVFTRVDEFIDERVMPAAENLLVVTSSVVVLAFRRKLEGLSDAEVVKQYEAQTVPNAHTYTYCRDAVGQPWRRCESEVIVEAKSA